MFTIKKVWVCVCVSVAARQGLWPILLQAMNMKAEDFIKKNQEEIFCHLLESSADNQV